MFSQTFREENFTVISFFYVVSDCQRVETCQECQGDSIKSW